MDVVLIQNIGSLKTEPCQRWCTSMVDGVQNCVVDIFFFHVNILANDAV